MSLSCFGSKGGSASASGGTTAVRRVAQYSTTPHLNDCSIPTDGTARRQLPRALGIKVKDEPSPLRVVGAAAGVAQAANDPFRTRHYPPRLPRDPLFFARIGPIADVEQRALLLWEGGLP